jgi:hypothetical protein
MQVLQDGPSAITLRQRAMDDAVNGFVAGLSKYEDAKNKQEATKREQALQLGQARLQLQKDGYDTSKISDEQLGASLGVQAPKEIGLRGLFAEEKAPTEKVDIFGTRTAEYNKKKEQADEDRTLANQKTKSEIFENFNSYRKGSAKAQNVALNPDGTPMTWEQKKQREVEIASEAKTKEEQRKRADPYNRLESLGAEGRGKVGAIASGLQAIDQMGKAFNAGQTMDYVDANTPLIGGLLSDTDVTASERTMSEVVGRLQSGGAIGVQEIKTFRDMGPRRGDSKEEKIKKLAMQRDFLNNKLTAFGLRPEELNTLGFKTTYDHAVAKGDGLGSSAHAGGNSGQAVAIKKEVQGLSRAEKEARAKAILESRKAKGL